MQLVVKPQRPINHVRAFRDDLGAAAATRQIMADVAVVLLDGKGQLFAGEEPIFGNETMKACPIVSQEGVIFEADFIE